MLSNSSTESFFDSLGWKILNKIDTDGKIDFQDYLSLVWESIEKNETSHSEFCNRPDWEEVKKRFLDFAYIDNEKEKEYKGMFETLQDAYGVVVEKIQTAASDAYELLLEYLSKYFDLLSKMFDDNIVRQENVISSKLCPMILSGCPDEKEEKKAVGVKNPEEEKCVAKKSPVPYNFYSPIIMENFLIIYDYTLHFAEIMCELDAQNHEIMKKVMQDLYINKCSRLFYMNLISENQPCICTPDNESFPVVYLRSDFSSIMMIKPIRWFDKIHGYIQGCKEEQKNSVGDTEKQKIKIFVVGYVKLEKNAEGHTVSEELERLAYVLDCSYGKRAKDEKKQFVFEIYVNERDLYFKNFLREESVSCFNCVFNIHKENYSKVFFATKICEALEASDIVLFLDNPNLYQNDFTIENVSPETRRLQTYKAYYERVDKKNAILPTHFQTAPIHHLISKFNIVEIDRKRKSSVLHYNINDAFLRFVQKKTKELGEKEEIGRKDVHIFYSSTNSIANASVALENDVREERYKGKAFRLVSMHTNDLGKRKLKRSDLKCNEHSIVFSLWSMVKNIDIHLFNDRDASLMKKLGITEKKELYWWLMNIFIKLRWTPDFRNFQYQIRIDKQDEQPLLNFEYVRKTVEELLTLILCHNDSAIGNCALNAFYSTIYSQIDSIDDAVFYCLFRSRNWSVIHPTVSFEYGTDFKENPVLSVNKPNRWTLVRAINALQKPISSDQYYGIAYELQKNSYKIAKLLSDICEICEHYGYTECRLYDNVKALQKGG